MTDSIGLTALDLTRVNRHLAREQKAWLEAEARRERPPRALGDEQADLAVRLAVAVAANEAATIEEALQVALDRVCAHTGWPVGHAYLLANDGALAPVPVWHLADPARFAPFRTAPP
ncbi:MAG: hypothetical protein ACREJ6_12030, partial [Candidatus Methylomirabilis sp.]